MEKIKKRSAFLTGFLVFIFFINLIFLLFYVSGGASHANLHGARGTWIPIISGTCSFLNLIFVVALFKLKKWGFWGIVIVAVVMFLINRWGGMTIMNAIGGLLIIPLLYGFLRMGGASQGWRQLD